MKVVCPDCERLVSLEKFRVEGSSLIVTCIKCSAETRVEPGAFASSPTPAPSRPVSQPPRVSLASTAGGSNVVVLRTSSHEAIASAARAADEGAFTIPDGVCPKCIARRGTTAECPHCGVRFETFDEASVLPPKWLRDAWVDLLRDWGSEARHTELRRHAQQADALATVGRLYRLRQAAVPEDPNAAEGVADILRLAAMPIGFTDDRIEQRRRTIVLLVVGAFACALMAVVARLLLFT